MLIQLLAINFMKVDQVSLKISFPFKLTIALGTCKLGFNPALVLQVEC